MDEPITFAGIIHDFGLVAYRPTRWFNIDLAAWEQILSDADAYDPMGRWRRDLTPLARQYGDYASLDDELDAYWARWHKVAPDVTLLPSWLLEGDFAGTYLGIVPRDIVGVVFHYLSRVDSCPYTRNTFFCGVPYDFNDVPGYTHWYPESDHVYAWSPLGSRRLAEDRPMHIQLRPPYGQIYWRCPGIPKPLRTPSCISCQEHVRSSSGLEILADEVRFTPGHGGVYEEEFLQRINDLFRTLKRYAPEILP